MQVKEVAILSGVSIRTLHHYDEIGLLVPDATTEAGYRMYSNENLARLQQILFYRELGFPLKQIKEIVSSPDFNRLDALKTQQKLLLQKQQMLNDMIQTIEQSIKEERGDLKMTQEERFKGFDFSSNQYEQEAKEHWGKNAVKTTNENLKDFGGAQQERMNDIYRHLAEIQHLSPESEQAQLAIHDWYQFLNTIGSYSLEAFEGLGEMYVSDERFTQNIDRFGDGLALFMHETMNVYVTRNL